MFDTPIESEIERYLLDTVAALGGVTRKVIYQGRRGAPDRHCYLPGGELIIVECKRPVGGVLHPLQERELDTLNRLGFTAVRVSTKEQIDEIFARFKA